MSRRRWAQFGQVMKGSMEPDVFVRAVEDGQIEGSILCQECGNCVLVALCPVQGRKRELQTVICMQRLGSKTLKWEILQGERTQHLLLQHMRGLISLERSVRPIWQTQLSLSSEQ